MSVSVIPDKIGTYQMKSYKKNTKSKPEDGRWCMWHKKIAMQTGLYVVTTRLHEDKEYTRVKASK